MNDTRIDMRRPMTHVSASQIQLFRDCPRKWYTTYVLGHFQPSTPSQELGKQIHTVAENYLQHAIEPPPSKAGEIFKLGLPHLPPPKTGVVEGGFEEVIGASPVPIKGFIDFLYESEDGTPIILDHKTTSSKRWMKAPHELALNIQMMTYARWYLTHNPDTERVILQHLYYGTRSSFSQLVEVSVGSDAVRSVWSDIEATIARMVLAHGKEECDAVQRISSCSAYGGCPFQNRCWTQEKKTMPRLIDEILAGNTPKKTSKKNPTNLQAVNPPDEEVMPVVPDDLEAQSQPPTRLLPTKPSVKETPQPLERAPRILFIRCLPSKDYEERFGKPLHYSDLIRPYSEDICEQYDVPHLSMAGSYGEGYKQLATKVAQNGWGDSPCIYINPMRSKGCEHVLDILVALADVVVEGT